VSNDELEYYRQRAVIERQCAAASSNAHAKHIHEQLADLYEKLVEVEVMSRPKLHIAGGNGSEWGNQSVSS
jgi:hypothetical protein